MPTYSGGVSEDAGDLSDSLVGGLGGLAGGALSLLGGLFSPTQPDPGSAAGGNGAFAPSETAGGPFGIGAKTLPGSVGNAPVPNIPNTLQFGPIPQYASTAPSPLTPLTPVAPLPGPVAVAGGPMGTAPSATIGGGFSPQVVTPGMTSNSPIPPQTQIMPQMAQAPGMPYGAPYNPQQPGPAPQPTAVGGQAGAAPGAPQMLPWQQAAMAQMQQAGLSPASMSQATMPTVLSGTIVGGPGQPTLVPPPPPNVPSIGAMPPEVQGQNNIQGLAQGMPQTLAQSLAGARENVGAFNHALVQGSKDIEQAAEIVKAGIMAPAKVEMDALKNSGMLEQRKALTRAIDIANKQVDYLLNKADRIGITSAERERAAKYGAAFAPKGSQRANFMDIISGNVETQMATADANTLRAQAAAHQEQLESFLKQSAALDEQFNKSKDRYQKSQALAETAAQNMRESYYKAADAMLGGVKGINELQAQDIRAFIADQQHQSQIEQQAIANQLTRDKINEAADAKKMEIAEKSGAASAQNYREAQKNRINLVQEEVKKMRAGLKPEEIAKATKMFMDQIDIGTPPEAIEAKK